MDFFYRALKLFAIIMLSFYVAKNLGVSILSGNLVFMIVISAGVYFLLVSSINQKFILFTITVFLPLFFPRLILNELKWVELVGPLMCLLLIIDSLINKRNVISKNTSIFFIAIGVLLLWSLINYARNPVSAGFLGGGMKEGGIRAYYTVFVGVTTFLGSYLFIRYKESPRLLTILLYTAVAVGNLIVINFFFPAVPLYFLKLMKTSIDQHKTFFRIPGISEMGALGIISILALHYNKKWNIFAILIFINALVLLVMSGGRTAFLGICLVIFLYITIVNKKYILPLVMIFILLSGAGIFLSGSITLPGQIERILDVKGGIEVQDEYRWSAYTMYLDIFKENPVFGKGIGWEEGTDKFVTQQLMQGGHGSYISILAIFGLGGLFYLLTMLIAGIYNAYKIFKNQIGYDDARLALFSFMFLILTAVNFYAGGNGIGDMKLWYLCGIVAGLRAKEGDKHFT